jgi:cathepsin L
VASAIQKVNNSRQSRASFTRFARDAVQRALTKQGPQAVAATRGIPSLAAAPVDQAKVIENLTEEQFTSIAKATIDALTGTTPPRDLPDRIRERNQAKVPAELQAAGPARALQANPIQGRQPNVTDPTFDWRTPGLVVRNTGIVTAAKNQETCGCCWAFAAIGTIEAAYARSNRRLISASEQYLLNQSGTFLTSITGLNYSCQGGWWPFDMLVPNALNGLQTPGVPKFTDLPYQGAPGPTPANLQLPYRLVSWGYVSSGNNPNLIPSDSEIKQALIDHGPLAVAINVPQDPLSSVLWTNYDGTGVIRQFDNSIASSVNHAIMIVGWDDSKNAWAIKNSWGPNWGTHGFGYVGYGQNNIGWGAAYVVP